MKFKIGNIIRGLPNNGYNWTNEDMTKAEVIAIDNSDKTMRIKALEHTDKKWKGSTTWVDNNSEKFELVNFEKITKEKLLAMPLGTKITTDLAVDNVFTKYSELGFRNENSLYLSGNNDINDDLTINDKDCGTKIVKVEEPTYGTVYANTREMTVAEIEKALGYPVKIVKEDD